MLNQALAFVVETVFHVFVLAALVRFWMQALKAPVRNPIAQFTMALTDFAVKPLRRVLPGLFKINTRKKPAQKARKGIDPFTKQERTFPAKPASTSVKVRPLKKLKDMAH